MIQLDLSQIAATPRLTQDQEALAAATDQAGPAIVKSRGSSGWSSLRAQLWDAQNGKCAYCETCLEEVSNEVDHIRPKDSSKYWWLAFSVSNLLLACRTCNNVKRSHFELQPGVRKLSPRQEPWNSDEPAMLVDPTSEDPADHITYVYAGGRWRIAAANDSERGAWTISRLKLDRMTFNRRANRFVRLAVVPLVRQLNQAIAHADTGGIRRATAELTALATEDAEWTQLMRLVIDAVRKGQYP